MELIVASRPSRAKAGIEGILLSLVPLPPLLTCLVGTAGSPPWSRAAALVAALACLAAALLLSRQFRLGKLFGFLALVGCALAGFPAFATEPLSALIGAVVVMQAGYFLSELAPHNLVEQRGHAVYRRLQRARSAVWTSLLLTLASFALNPARLWIGDAAVAGSTILTQLVVLHWIWTAHRGPARLSWALLPLTALAVSGIGLYSGCGQLVTLCLGLATLFFLPGATSGLEPREQWWEPFLNHPARVLITTFFVLCLAGALLLQLPWATTEQSITLVDAAFTSVSAVCVTGLTVLDTPRDFTLLGQGCILLLIQLGGFGIMTLTTVALHAMGKRLSLRQERLLTTLTETSHQDLIDSLLTIVRFTLLTELAGAVLLSLCFLDTADSLPQALWQGLFTSISAFCNAGFALQSANLVPYQSQPLVLHTVAALIVLGGLAPATCLLLPQWVRGKKIALAPRIALVTTTALLLTGTLCFLMFEWHNALDGLSLPDKLHNAWFQSVTLRTAGFNSIDLGNVLSPTLLIMLSFMFIGGSPGGTAGGIKTTTVGILAMTFWACITGRDEVIAQNRRIPQSVINRGITVLASGAMIWLVMVMALVLTQPLPARALIFEATSALGTVGLSLGVTPHLDEIGKIIVMLTMFIGRIGPMTMFTLLSGDLQATGSRCPDARITLT